MVIQSRHRLEDQCRQLLMDFNNDIKSYSNDEITRSFICNKWNTFIKSRKLEGNSCRSLKLQIKDFCKNRIGI